MVVGYELVVTAVCLGVIALLSIPAITTTIRQLFHKQQQYRQLPGQYQDADGVATQESIEAYSDIAPRSVLVVTSILGFCVSATFVVLATVDKKSRCISHEVECKYQDNLIWLEQCLTFVSWALILSQAVVIFKTHSTIQKYNLGICGAVSCLLLVGSLVTQGFSWNFYQHSPPASTPYYLFVLVQLVFILVLLVAFVLIPRRPDVYRDGKIVDREFTTTLLQRATFSWATPMLKLATARRNLELEDLPLISGDIRAATLRQKFDDVPQRYSLVRAIFVSNRPAFLLQWTLQAFQSVTNFFPQAALLISLRLLEARDNGQDNRLALWAVVIALGLSDAAQTWLETSMFYICYNKLGAPVYEQISSIVFAKALRKKDVKGVSRASETTNEEDDDAADIKVNKGSGLKGEDTVPENDAEDEVAKTKQSTINLIGVDGKRIADFATYNPLILGAVLKITLALIFLVNLVGVLPLTAGFAAFAALMPLNWWVSTRYARAQDLLMKLRDGKMAVVNEALQGIRQIKFSALENEWHDKIGKSRAKELKTLWRAFILDVLLISVWIFGPVILSAITLAVYALINKTLTASIAFTTMSIFEAIELTLAVVPECVSEGFDAYISSKRIEEYLRSPDQDDDIQPGNAIRFADATISWPSDAKDEDPNAFKLRGLNLEFPNFELSVISGKTGSGKSLLLASIVGEAEVADGTLMVPRAPSLAERFDHKANRDNWYINSAIAYVSQIPWIENATIKDNILFGLPLDKKRYQDVMEASALQKDMDILQDGDLTDIGANGINLSGGQKWRVSFARALYSRAGCLILDDIFSAVDAHVGKHLYEKALTGPLGRGRTRILVTHHVGLCLPGTKYSVLLDNGVVLEAGYTDQLRQSGALKNILAYDVEEQKKEDDESALIDDGGSLQKVMSHRSNTARRISALSQASVELTRTRSQVAVEGKRPEPKKFTEDEKREVGAVKYTIYNAYVQACGGYWFWVFILVFFVMGNVLYLGRSYWVSIWTRSYSTESASTHLLFHQLHNVTFRFRESVSTIESDPSLRYYLGIYMAISLISWLVGSAKYFLTYYASIRASKQLFDRLSWSILRAPLRFLDTTPMGRILNRFTADFNLVDSRMASDLGFSLHSAVSGLAVIVAGSFVSPLMLVAAGMLLVVCIWFAKRYLAAAREIKRLESNAKSPVFEQFGSVLTGIGTIRAFGKSDEYMKRMEKKIDTHCQAYSSLWLLTRWMSLRIGFVGSIFLTAMGALVVSIDQIDAPLAGFALSFSLQLSECVIWALRQYSNVELNMNAIERVVEYSTMPTEDQGGLDPPAAWPSKGEVEVHDLVVSYAEDLPPVLRGLTFHVKSNERVGVVGRTGAGKSSLTLALFRFLEARTGSIHIDGVDTSKIKLFDLRSRLAIIPQDPVLFSGTVRSNLDAFDQLEDSQLRDALARVHLISSTSAEQSGSATPVGDASDRGADRNTNIFKSLQSKISEGGLNLSQGQRQLLCLARAIVSRPKIMVLDEATSSVDMQTDALIQRSIREEFADSTLIVIAHRLSTIADFDRILVLGEGKVLEFDSPGNLMKINGGVFRGMVEESGERKELEGIILGSQAGPSK